MKFQPILWFICIWLISVLALFIVSSLIRYVLM
ncbi:MULTISPECIES: DUF2474 family protein [Vibrio]